MNKKIATSFLVLILTLISYSAQSQSADDKIGALIDNGDYFSLYHEFPLLKDSISPLLRDLGQSLLDVCKNKPEEATKSIETLLSTHQNELGIDNVVNLTILLVSQYGAMHDYDMALATLNHLLESELPHSTRRNINNHCDRIRALMDIGKTEVTVPADVYEIPIEIKNMEGLGELITVDAKINGTQEQLIFDTGADGQCYFSEPFARKHNIRIIADSIPISGIITSNYAKWGVVDSIEIGGIKIRNVVATIGTWDRTDDSTPDSIKNVLDKAFYALLGSHIMKELGKIQLYPQEKRLVFEKKNEGQPHASNLFFMHGQPYVEAVSRGKRFGFHFDSGDMGSFLNSSYYHKNKKLIELTGTRDFVHSGGFGGTRLIDLYTIASLPLNIKGIDMEIPDITVHVEDNQSSLYDGRLGMSFLRQLDKVTFDFRQMYLAIEPIGNKNEELEPTPSTPDEKVIVAINTKDYIEIDRLLKELTGSITPFIKDLAAPMLNLTLNRHDIAFEKLNYMVSTYGNNLGYGNLYKSLLLMADELMYVYRYNDAANLSGQIIEQSKTSLPMNNSTIALFESKYKMNHALRNTPPSNLSRGQKDCVVPAVFKYINGKDLLLMPAKTEKGEGHFILDTDANLWCNVSEKFALKHHITTIADSIPLNSDKTQWGKLGIINHLKIGNIDLYNIVCQVGIDKDKYDVGITDAVFGNRMLELLGEIQIFPKQKKIIIPLQGTSQKLNLTNNFGVPVFETFINNNRYLFKLDTGKGKSVLSPLFFRKNKSFVESKGQPTSEDVNQILDILDTRIYQLSDLHIKISDKDITIPKITVYTYDTLSEQTAGSLSIDILKKTDKITLNFKDMFIKIE